MRKLLTAFVALAAVAGGVLAAMAQSAHTPDQAKAFVNKAVTFYQSAGKEKALAAFSDPKGEFVDGDLYLFVMNANDGKLTMLAHGVNKGLIGKSQIEVKDAEGKAFNQDMAAALTNSGEGWMEYKWPNPATKKIATKRSYFVKVDDVVIGAGVYQ